MTLTAISPTLDRRFWAKVKKSEGCWLWTAGTTKGYGRISIPGGVLLAHRLSYEMHHGPIPEGLWVLHKCDVRQCVNPDHLFAGTPDDNVQDCVSKGRRVTMRGVHHGRAKLNDTSVAVIRSSSLTNRELADIFEVDWKVISNARNGITWKHVASKPRNPYVVI